MKPMPRKSNKEKDRIIIQLTKEGKSANLIGKILGLSHTGVMKAQHRLKLIHRERFDKKN